MTVCPPKGSNTALNYDLILARNVSFTDDLREKLKDAVWTSFIENEHKTYVAKLMDIANPSSMGEIYKVIKVFPCLMAAVRVIGVSSMLSREVSKARISAKLLVGIPTKKLTSSSMFSQ